MEMCGDRLPIIRGGTKSLIFHVTCTHTNACHCGCIPHTVTVLKLKNRGIPNLNSVVSITDHGHVLFGDSEGSPSKITAEVLLCKVHGDKK